MYKNKHAQSVLEFVLLLSIVIAGLLILGYYIRNSLSGKLREAADTFGQGEVYMPLGGSEVTQNADNK